MHRIIELTRDEIADDGLEVGLLNFSLAVDGAICAKAIYDKVDGLICPTGHDGRQRPCPRHTCLQRNSSELKAWCRAFVPIMAVI